MLCKSHGRLNGFASGKTHVQFFCIYIFLFISYTYLWRSCCVHEINAKKIKMVFRCKRLIRSVSCFIPKSTFSSIRILPFLHHLLFQRHRLVVFRFSVNESCARFLIFFPFHSIIHLHSISALLLDFPARRIDVSQP